MPDVLKRLAGPVALSVAAANLYTVPAATSAVLRGLRVVNETATAASFSVALGGDAAGKRLWYAQVVAPGDGYDWSGNIPLAAAEYIQAYASVGAALTIVVSGVETT